MKKLCILFAISILIACHPKKAEVKQTAVQITYRDPEVAKFVSLDSNGVITATNLAGETIIAYNVHDTLKKPCKTCHYKGIALCDRYKKEMEKLYKKLQNCEKGDYYIPSKKDSTKVDLPAAINYKAPDSIK